jgi:large subunit ribosomal protein L23
MKDPYEIIKARYVTEKATVLEKLQSAKKNSNRSLARCQSPKYLFTVDIKANKREIASAIEEIYREQKVRVAKVNTILMKSKPKRRGRGRPGKTAAFKKAIVTMEPGDSIDNVS